MANACVAHSREWRSEHTAVALVSLPLQTVVVAVCCRFQYDHGPIHFVHYSTEHTFHVGSEQHAWMERALAAVDRRRTPWLVVVGHRPIYVNSLSEEEPDGDQVIAQELRDAFEGMFKDYGVDVTLHGHHHAYQRSCPLYKGKCKGLHKNGEAKGIVHMVIGNAGKSLSRNEPSHAPKVCSLRIAYNNITVHATTCSRTHVTMVIAYYSTCYHVFKNISAVPCCMHVCLRMLLMV